MQLTLRNVVEGAAPPIPAGRISRRLLLSQGSVFDIFLPRADLKVHDHMPNFGYRGHFRVSGAASSLTAGIVDVVHPYLQTIFRESGLPSLLAVRRGRYAVVVDKVEDAAEVEISCEMGLRLPLLVGAAGRALLCQLSDAERHKFFREVESLGLASHIFRKASEAREAVIRGRGGGLIGYVEENVKGTITIAVPINAHRAKVQAALLVIGLKRQWRHGRIFSVSRLLDEASVELGCCFQMVG